MKIASVESGHVGRLKGVGFHISIKFIIGEWKILEVLSK